MKTAFPQHHLFQFLKRFDNQSLPLDLLLSHYFRANKALGAKDRSIIAEAIYGMTRWRGLLDHLAGTSPTWEKRYAVYTGFQPNQYLFVNSIPLHVRVSFPKELFDLLVKNHGEEKAIHLCQTCNTPAPTTIRINPLKISRLDLLKRWENLYDVYPTERSPYGICFRKKISFYGLPEYKEGLFEVQDEGSQLLSLLLQAQPGDSVLDYCAGAGGKTLAFAHLLQNKGQIFLHDIRPFSLEQARKRLRRAGIQNAQLLFPESPNQENLKRKMDWVFIDAPCSGTGTLRRNPDMKWKFSKELLDRLIDQQRMIFEKALSFVRPGGKIVYATCSMLKEENEHQLEHFLKTHPVSAVGETFSTLPTFGGMDGFFGVVLTKS